ncbi:MAG: hypothetical protein ACI4Q3_05720 [Kiritimatiellia bacterium]
MKRSKRGSALLIVLGFLSFMVVSAVAFSIYMRSERLPSSALRRAVANRHLVKAALARAIGDIDDALRHEPFPGCLADGPRMEGSAYGKRWPGGSRRALWYGRVFMPICQEGPVGQENDITAVNADELYLVPDTRRDETVATMTLEGLGYVPPPLANEARLLGPKSWAAKWHYFDYDAGRYAYTALNVSDYFDLNRVHAATNRNSGVDGRLSLAYLFADTSGKIQTSKAEAFEQFVHRARNGQPRFAFVSMLDYSLALAGSAASYNLANPFYDYLKSGSRPLYYGNSWGDGYNAVKSDEDYLKIARQVFVTDSWCPATNVIDRANTVNLSESDWQPFDNVPEQNANLVDLSEENKFWNKFLKEFPIPTAAMLYDYLDADDIPTSLVLPCTEFMPMIAEFDISGQPELILKTSSSEETDDAGNVISTTTTYSMDLNVPRLDVAVTPVFPFKRGRDRMASTSYGVQAVVRLFFAPAGTLNRSSGFGAVDWTQYSSQKAEIESMSSVVFVSDRKSFSIPANVQSENDAEISGVMVTLPAFNQGDLKLLEVTQKKGAAEQVVIPDGAFRFLNADYTAGEVGLADVVPQVTVNLRITCGNDTVDVVPARATDDKLNSRERNSSINNINEVCGSQTPLLRFTTTFAGGKQLTLTKEGLAALTAGGAQANLTADAWGNTADAYVCCDPRFNWAPEDWFLRKSSGDGFKDWLEAAGNLLGSSDAHDSDIFMNASNVGYLQSIGEFMFIPRVSSLDGSHDPEWGFLRRGDTVYNGAVKTDVTQLANRDCMWRCYKASQLGGNDDLYGLNVINGTGGYKVNPYTDNAQIFLAAIANTPVDWWAAGTNTNTRTSSKTTSDLKFSTAITDTYGPENATDKWTWDQVGAVSSALHAQLLANSSSPNSWLTAYDNFWRDRFNSDSEKQLFGVDLDSALCEADRKFLYDYWRGCFGCCQQLFLIFVRAESTALGGSGDGRTPGQLGARAVALVWRDPNEPKDSQDADYAKPLALSEGDTDGNPRPPHKTRILFYHQFD